LICREAFGCGSLFRGNEITAQATNEFFLVAVMPWAKQAE